MGWNHGKKSYDDRPGKAMIKAMNIYEDHCFEDWFDVKVAFERFKREVASNTELLKDKSNYLAKNYKWLDSNKTLSDWANLQNIFVEGCKKNNDPQ